MRRLLYLLAFAFICCSFAPVCPIHPQPLRKLIKGCQVIIEGTVLEVTALDPAQYPREVKHRSHRARIAVTSWLQGQPAGDTLDVFCNPDMICPLPDRYPLKASVLAFLDRVPQGSGYYTHGLSHGVKVLSQEARQAYQDRIKEMQAILKLDNALQKEPTINWLVKCAQTPSTRLEGTYELTPGTYFPAQPGSGQDDIKIYGLNKEQKALLFDALIKAGNITYSELGLIDLVWGYDNDQLVKLMGRYIR